MDACFEDKELINLEEFITISEQKASDMVLSVLSLFRERLPCSENYWRYKHNYELHVKIMEGESMRSRSNSPPTTLDNAQMSGDEETKDDGTKKLMAKAHMSFIAPLSPYNKGKKDFFKMCSSPVRSSDGSGSDTIMEEDEDKVTEQIPLDKFKSNQEAKKQKFIETNDASMDSSG